MTSCNYVLKVVEEAKKRPGLLSVSPTRHLPPTHRTLTPTSKAASPLPQHCIDMRRQRAFALLYQLTGFESPFNRPSVSPLSQQTTLNPGRIKRLRRAKKPIFLEKDKEVLEKKLTLVTQTKDGVPETPVPLSDIERLALEMETQRTPLRGRAMTEQEAEDSPALQATMAQTPPCASPALDPIDLLSTQVSPAKSDQGLFFPLLPSVPPSKPVRRVIDIPAYPFGQHKPIPDKVELMLLDEVEIRIRRKRTKLKKLVSEIESKAG